MNIHPAQVFSLYASVASKDFHDVSLEIIMPFS